MQRFDSWLIEKHEQFAHWFQRWTGLTNFWLCKAAYLLFILSPVAHVVPLAYSGIVATSLVPVLLVLAGLGLLAKGRVFGACDLLEDHYAHGDGTAHLGTLRAREYWQMRIVMMFGVSLLGCVLVFLQYTTIQYFGVPPLLRIISFTFMLCWWSAVSHVYFLVGIPLPPGKSKVQEWLESFQSEPEKATMPVQ